MTRDERLDRCERILASIRVTAQFLSERVSELEIQTRFMLSLMRVAKPGTATTLVGANGKPQLEIVDGFTIYHAFGGRAKTLDLLETELLTVRFTERALEIKHAGDARTVEAILDALIVEFRAQREEESLTRDHRPDTDADSEDDFDTNAPVH
jgi:hypothetical protein